MSKTFSIIILSLSVISIPWIVFNIWEILPYEFKLNTRIIRNIVTICIGVIIGIIFIKQSIKLHVLILMLLLFVGTNVTFSILRFESNKQDLLQSKIDFDPQQLPECEKESNFEDIWDYMSNGCHYSTEEFISTIIDRVLILTITILLSRILFKTFSSSKIKKKDLNLIDQKE